MAKHLGRIKWHYALEINLFERFCRCFVIMFRILLKKFSAYIHIWILIVSVSTVKYAGSFATHSFAISQLPIIIHLSLYLIKEEKNTLLNLFKWTTKILQIYNLECNDWGPSLVLLVRVFINQFLREKWEKKIPAKSTALEKCSENSMRENWYIFFNVLVSKFVQIMNREKLRVNENSDKGVIYEID